MTLIHRAFVFESIKQIFILQYYCLASVVLLYYDHLLTFPKEVRRVWRRRLTLSSVLFLVNRYVVSVGYIFVLYLFFFPPSDGIEFCKWASRVGGYLSLLTQIVASVLLSLRTYALYNRSWKVLCFVSLLGLSAVITSAWTINVFFGILMAFGRSGGGSGNVFRTCVPARITNPSLFRATAYLSTIFDGVVFLLTFSRTLHIVRQNKSAGARTDLPHLLMRDGSIYFAVMTIANLANVIIFSDKNIPSTEFAQSTGNNAMLSHVISATMISRLVLNLHGFEDRKRKVVNKSHRPPRYAIRQLDGALPDDTTRESSSIEGGIDQDTTQLTTQISVYSTLVARVMDGFESDVIVEEKDDIGTSPSSRTSITSSSHSYSTHFGDGSAWFDEDESQNSRCSSVLGTEKEWSGVKEFSEDYGV